MNKLSNLPPKGTSDWFPEEYQIRKYIFDTWRRVCISFGYEEYLTPIIESAEVFRAKSGEDIGGKELMTMIDRAGRELAIRPEMTPSVTRMVSRVYEQSSKPLRYFSIANFMRNEKPQKGRNREFWQLNCDIFGSSSVNADVEILQLSIEIMKSFGADETNFVFYFNDRRLIDAFIRSYLKVENDKVQLVTRIIDKFRKIPNDELVKRLKEEASATISNEQEFINYLSGDEKIVQEVQDLYFKNDEGFQNVKKIIELLGDLGYSKYLIFNPSMVRGFDYYDGIIFEVFDRKMEELRKDKDNNITYRSLFGGGRYNGLAAIFGSKSFPAVGFAPGDETTRIFLQENGLIDSLKLKRIVYYVPLISNELIIETNLIVQTLRDSGKEVILGLEEQRVGKALDYANKRNLDFVVIFGEDEKAKMTYKIKNMGNGEEVEYRI